MSEKPRWYAAAGRKPAGGDVVRLTHLASPQFRCTPTSLRITRVDLKATYTGWGYIEGYVLLPTDLDVAIEKRMPIFVQLEGLLYSTPARTAPAPLEDEALQAPPFVPAQENKPRNAVRVARPARPSRVVRAAQ